MEDIELLREYAEHRSQQAFAELVDRRMNLVYATALRKVGDADLAKDVAQMVFLDLARKAKQLRRETVLTGWLYRSTHYAAANVLRAERRRHKRETTAMQLMELNSDGQSVWREVAPLLDEAMRRLSRTDQDALLLRYFEGKSCREVGQALGMSDDALQKRVARALEKLRSFFARKGVKVSVAALVPALAANAVQAAPAGLAASGVTHALAATPLSIVPALFSEVLTLVFTTNLKAKLGLALLGVGALGIVWPVGNSLSSTSSDRPWSLANPTGALRRECGFIINCGFTEHALNTADASPLADAYGVLNNNRLSRNGPDWASVFEAPVAAIGLMAGGRQLSRQGEDISIHSAVLKAFFETWLMERQQPVATNTADPDFGGMFHRLYYTPQGMRDPARKPDLPDTATTGRMLSSMWKYYEFLRATGQSEQAARWLTNAWPTAARAGEFLNRMFDPTWKLVRVDSSNKDLTVEAAAHACAGLRCLDRWGRDLGVQPPFDCTALANQLSQGIAAMKNPGAWTTFYRLRDSSAGYALSYGNSIDDTCFAPYKVNALDPAEPFCRELSDWWTQGGGGIYMTWSDSDPTSWRNFGTRWRWYFDGRVVNNYLYAGNTAQIGLVEWKHAHATRDPVTRDRARKRLEWVVSRSELWMEATNMSDAGVPNGLISWRDTVNRLKSEPLSLRFACNSAYLVQLVLMTSFDQDTRWIPDEG